MGGLAFAKKGASYNLVYIDVHLTTGSLGNSLRVPACEDGPISWRTH